MSSILLVEDDAAIVRGLTEALVGEGHEVFAARDGEAGQRLIREREPDLVVLDIMLPKLSGYELCRKARSEGFTSPILMLTARGEEADLVLGLDLGADDYLTKPFSVRELLARVRALLRRSHPAASPPEEMRVDDVVIDFKGFEARKGDTVLQLTRKEYQLLRYLAGRVGEVVSRHELLHEVWGYKAYPTTRTVDTHVASLRSKIEDDASDPRHLLTVHGVGYKLVL